MKQYLEPLTVARHLKMVKDFVRYVEGIVVNKTKTEIEDVHLLEISLNATALFT